MKSQYADDRSLDITAYLGPRRAGKNFYNGVYGACPLDPEDGYPSFITDEVFQLYKEAGLNFLMPEGDAFYGQRLTKDGFVEEPDFEKSDLYYYMEVAERNGLGVYPTSEELFGKICRGEGEIGEKEKKHIKDMVATIQKYFPKTFWGLMVTDEPPYQCVGRVQSVMDYLRSEEIRSIKPDLKIFASMLPMYGALLTLGPENQNSCAKSINEAIQRRKSAYEYYLNLCADAMGEFSFDFYSFIYESQISPWYYTNLEMAAKKCKMNDIPLAITLQACRLDDKVNEKTGRARVVYRTPNYLEMRWQVYSALAFGASRLGYYTFWTHYAMGTVLRQPDAMVVYEPSEECGYRTTGIYDAVKKVHTEILQFDHVFLRFKWQGAKVVRKSLERNIRNVDGDYDGSSLISHSASRDMLVGCMLNPEDGKEGFWIVNADNPFHFQVNDVELIFKDTKKITYYRTGKEYEADLEQVIKDGETCGKWKVRLGAGEGIFVIPQGE